MGSIFIHKLRFFAITFLISLISVGSVFGQEAIVKHILWDGVKYHDTESELWEKFPTAIKVENGESFSYYGKVFLKIPGYKVGTNDFELWIIGKNKIAEKIHLHSLSTEENALEANLILAKELRIYVETQIGKGSDCQTTETPALDMYVYSCSWNSEEKNIEILFLKIASFQSLELQVSSKQTKSPFE